MQLLKSLIQIKIWNDFTSEIFLAKCLLGVLRLFIGVVLGAAVLVFTGVDVRATEIFSVSESESCAFRWANDFFADSATSFIISFWISANSLARSDIISLLKEVIISSKFSGCTLGDLLGLAIRFSGWLFSTIEASNSLETSSATALLFWLLVVILSVEK